MALADSDETLVTGKAWTEPRQIEERLAEITEHMENVIQKYLRDDYDTIADYNQEASRIPEAYRLLLVFDFPTNMSDTALRRLISILRNGPRCGVYAIVVVDTNLDLPHNFNPAEMEQNCEVIHWSEEAQAFKCADPDYGQWAFEWEQPPPKTVLATIIEKVGGGALEGKRVEVPFAEITPPASQWWNGNTRNGITIPLGPAGPRKVQSLRLGYGTETAHHALIAGKTGSGKSTLFHVVATGLALIYPPEELQVFLIDFKKGVEFKCYATAELPHARVIAIESDREFGLSVLEGLEKEITKRGDLFREAEVNSISAYRDQTGKKMPRILLLVDEFQVFFTEDDSVSTRASKILDGLARQGRSFGVHVILGSQTLAGAYTLARSTMAQMGVRIALQCSEADSRLILADDNPAAKHITRPGQAIYNANNGLVDANNSNDFFQVAWLDEDERVNYLNQIRSVAESREYVPPEPQVVFEGNAPARAEKNLELNELLLAPRWDGPQNFDCVWLGEPVRISGHVAAKVRRQSGSNVLIVGQNEESAIGIMSHVLVALAAQHKPDRSHRYFHVFDFSLVDSAHAGVLGEVVERLPQGVSLSHRRDIVDTIREIDGELRRRLEDPDRSYPPIFLVIHGLQRARDLRPDEAGGFGAFREEGVDEPISDQFARILREGPELRIHTLVWCDTMGNLHRSCDRRAVREFAMRVAFQMSAEDSASLIDTPLANRLGPYRALFLDENEGRIEKFRPYGLPSADWIAEVSRRFAAADKY